MEAALADAGVVAASLPLYVEGVDADVGRFVPLCVAKVKTPALQLKMRLRLDAPQEVFQQWEHAEEDEQEEEESCFVSFTAGGGVHPLEKRGIIKRGGGDADPAETPTPFTRGGGFGEGGKGEIAGIRARVTSSPCVAYCTTAEIKGYNPECARPVLYRFFDHDLSAFDLDEESTIQPSRHTDALATELQWSANILSIKVPTSAVGYPVYLYGSIYVRDDLDRKRVYLFRCDRDNAQLVKCPEEALTLTGPSRGLVVFDNLFFEIDLKMRCDQKMDDMNFSQGSIQYSHVYNSSRLLCYKSYLFTKELATEASNVEVRYAVVQRAVEASIQIKVREGLIHREGVSSFHGKVTAFITGISEEMVLFDSEASCTVMNIRADGSFELWRSVISVPIDGSLRLRVETWEGGSKANFSICSTMFIPKICDEDVAPCAFHPIRIKVAWSPLYIPKFDNLKITV